MVEETQIKKSNVAKRILITAAASLAIGGSLVNAQLTNEGEGLLGEGVKMLLPAGK